MAATRLIAMHVNKGKTLARTLADRTDYAHRSIRSSPASRRTLRTFCTGWKKRDMK